MKAVLVATDFLKDVDNTFKSIETNTGIHLVIKDISNYFNTVEFDSFLVNNNIDTIDLIKPTHRFDSVYDLDAQREYYDFSTDTIEGFLLQHYSGSTITFNFHTTYYGSQNIPQIEDADNKLILRISYDGNALIDETYAKDNWEFLNLMNEQYPNSIQATYINNLELGFDTIGTTIRNNGDFPNYIIKERYPTTDYNNYPKILKIDNITKLTEIKNSLSEYEYLQEYIFNSEDTIEGKLKTYRTVTMIYGNNLDTFNIINPYIHTNPTSPSTTVDYDDDGYIQVWERPSFIQKMGLSKITTTYHFDETSKIVLNDGTFSNINNISVNSDLKTLNIIGTSSNVPSTFEWRGELDDILINSEEVPTTVQSYDFVESSEWLINITLDGGIKFYDSNRSPVLVVSTEDSNIIQFKEFHYLNEGDILVVYNLETQSYEQKTVSSIEYSYEKLKFYTVNVEPYDTFLTSEEDVDSPTYVMIQHNNDPCLPYACESPASIYGACLNNGSDGYCPFSGFYEYCSTTSIRNCTQSAGSCVDCVDAQK